MNKLILETVADIAYLAGQYGYYSGDSREDMQKFIHLAHKFEKQYVEVDWNDTEIDYMCAVEHFAIIELGMENPLFKSRMTMMDFSKLTEMLQHVIDVELQPVRTGDNDTEWVSEEEANACAVYFRYSLYAIENLNMNPSDWLGDFDSVEDAENFQRFIKALLKQNPLATIK